MNLMQDIIDTYFKILNQAGSASKDFPEQNVLEPETIRVLSLLFLARVDGKSPVEYITEEKDRELIRTLSYELIQARVTNFNEVASLILENLEGD